MALSKPEHDFAVEVLETAAERWLDAKASGKDTSVIDREVQAAQDALASLQTSTDRRN
jgi:hypothetical protein